MPAHHKHPHGQHLPLGAVPRLAPHGALGSDEVRARGTRYELGQRSRARRPESLAPARPAGVRLLHSPIRKPEAPCRPGLVTSPVLECGDWWDCSPPLEADDRIWMELSSARQIRPPSEREIEGSDDGRDIDGGGQGVASLRAAFVPGDMTQPDHIMHPICCTSFGRGPPITAACRTILGCVGVGQAMPWAARIGVQMRAATPMNREKRHWR